MLAQIRPIVDIAEDVSQSIECAFLLFGQARPSFGEPIDARSLHGWYNGEQWMQVVKLEQLFGNLIVRTNNTIQLLRSTDLKSQNTLIKCANVSARIFGVGPLKISCTVQKLVWLKRLVNATMLGATTCLIFLSVQAQLVSSSGWMAAKSGKSSKVSWPASSSGDTRSALNITESRLVMEELSGRLCVLFGGVEPRLRMLQFINVTIKYFKSKLYL